MFMPNHRGEMCEDVNNVFEYILQISLVSLLIILSNFLMLRLENETP